MRFEATGVDDDDVLRGSGDGSVLEEFRRLVLTACIAHGDGLVSGALDMTAGYLKERQQFGKPLGAFQAVQQELADVYIISRTLHVISQSVAWRVSEGLTGTADRYETDPTIGAYWLAAEGPRAVQILHHLHGGVGVDITYPMFRYSSAVKDLARFVGGAQLHLDTLGAAPSSTSPPRSGRCRPSCASTSPRSSRPRRRRTSPPPATATPTRRSSSAWAATAGWAWAGPPSSAARASATSSSCSSPTRPPAPTCRCRR